MSKRVLIRPQASPSAYVQQVFCIRRLRIREHFELRDQSCELKRDDPFEEWHQHKGLCTLVYVHCSGALGVHDLVPDNEQQTQRKFVQRRHEDRDFGLELGGKGLAPCGKEPFLLQM